MQVKALQKYKDIRTKTLAVLDDRSRGDMHLLFTTKGIMPIINGEYTNEKLDMDKVYELIKKLAAKTALQTMPVIYIIN